MWHLAVPTATVMTADLTIACAVWHRQSHRDLLFAQHVRSLLRQTVPVNVIYVADGGHELAHPDERVTIVSVDRGVTVAESFMMALALTDTTYFAALNLDDCYFTDAAEVHLDFMRTHDLDMVGGDWEIRFTPVAHTDRPSFGVEALRPCPQWPPTPGPGQRLGSGDGARRTFGPAPVFRTAAVRQVGGYARAFGDGTPVATIIDYILWDRLARAGKRIGRLPQVVGSYLSDPASQQEFRSGGADGIAEEHRRYDLHGAAV